MLKGEALALNDAELECAAGGVDVEFEGLTRLVQRFLNPHILSA